MKNPRPDEENIIKDIGNIFRLKIELITLQIKDVQNLFRQDKETAFKK